MWWIHGVTASQYVGLAAGCPLSSSSRSTIWRTVAVFSRSWLFTFQQHLFIFKGVDPSSWHSPPEFSSRCRDAANARSTASASCMVTSAQEVLRPFWTRWITVARSKAPNRENISLRGDIPQQSGHASSESQRNQTDRYGATYSPQLVLVLEIANAFFCPIPAVDTWGMF